MDSNPDAPQCYHIWVLAGEGKGGKRGQIFYRWGVCYAKRTAALAAVRRWQQYAPDDGERRGRRPSPNTCVYMVRRCDNLDWWDDMDSRPAWRKGMGLPCGCDCPASSAEGILPPVL